MEGRSLFADDIDEMGFRDDFEPEPVMLQVLNTNFKRFINKVKIATFYENKMTPIGPLCKKVCPLLRASSHANILTDS